MTSRYYKRRKISIVGIYLPLRISFSGSARWIRDYENLLRKILSPKRVKSKLKIKMQYWYWHVIFISVDTLLDKLVFFFKRIYLEACSKFICISWPTLCNIFLRASQEEDYLTDNSCPPFYMASFLAVWRHC